MCSTTRILYKVPLVIVQKPSDINYSSALVYALHSLCYLFMFQEESKIIPVYFSTSGLHDCVFFLVGKGNCIAWLVMTENVDSYLDLFKLLLSGLLTAPGALTTTSGCQRTPKSIQFQTPADHFPALLPGM